MKRKTRADAGEIVVQDRSLPVDAVKDLVATVYKAILKKLGRYDSYTWQTFQNAIRHMKNEELKLEWEAILDGTISNVVETLQHFGEQDETVQKDIINIFEGLAKPYFEKYKGDVPKEDLEWAHKLIRDYFADLKRQKILEEAGPAALPEPRRMLEGKLRKKGVRIFRGAKTKAAYIRSSDLEKAVEALGK
jgi:hypothetical protein